MQDERTAAPDNTAVRVALWRAMHVEVDAPPHVLEDEIGLKLVAPDDGWRRRPDMDADGTRLFRASIVARARFGPCSLHGGSGRFFPDRVRLDLELLEERRFDSGVISLRYDVRRAAGGLASGVKSSEILPA
ncbi:MAG TPA: hypothetical protein VFE06_04125 [Acidobacteriaceae bacterium]|jgi:hypothetical protein|nr:hypothetical protein [Acidobacteriaceae bacterium]